MSKERGLGTLCSDEHFQTAYKIAAESMVLLKNDNSLLPLDASKKMTIAVIGENATRSMCKAGGSSELKAKREISPLEGIKSRFPNADVVYTMGYASGPSTYGRVLPSVLNADSLHPFYIILNVAFGGGWGGAEGVDYSVLPCTMEVDWVRVYQK